MFREQNIQKTLMGSILLSVILFLIYGANLLCDELEHLRAGYLISIGLHPYSDFFEHHHPLLWWIFAPIISVFPHNQFLLFYIARTLTTLVSCGSAYYIYQISKRFLGGKKVAIIALCIYFSFYFAQTIAVVFKPDAYMWFFYLCGLYHFFTYIETEKQKHLYITAVASTISFIFLQTALFLLIPMGLVALYLIYRKPSQWKNNILGFIPAIILLSLFFLSVHLTSGIVPYYQRCWILNSYMYKALTYEEPFLPKFGFFIFVGYMAYGYQIKMKQATVYTHFTAILLTISFLKNIVYLAPFPNYFQAEALAISFLLAPLVPQMPKIGKNYLIASLFVFNILNILTSLYFLPNKPYWQQISLVNKDKNALVYPTFFNIYTPHYPFYWFFPELENLDGNLFNRSFDMNKYILDNQIDYLVDTDQLETNFKVIVKPTINSSGSKEISTDISSQYLFNQNMLDRYYEKISDYPSVIYRHKSGL